MDYRVTVGRINEYWLSEVLSIPIVDSAWDLENEKVAIEVKSRCPQFKANKTFYVYEWQAFSDPGKPYYAALMYYYVREKDIRKLGSPTEVEENIFRREVYFVNMNDIRKLPFRNWVREKELGKIAIIKPQIEGLDLFLVEDYKIKRTEKIDNNKSWMAMPPELTKLLELS